MNAVVSPTIQDQLRRLSDSMPQTLLLSGKQGVGLRTIAYELASEHQILFVTPSLLNKTSSTKQISVATIRELYEQTRSKSLGTRVVIVDDADTMTPQAQNAFLKLLEEPNDSTSFILTTHHIERLLPTVRSRSQLCTIPVLDATQTADFLETLDITDSKKLQQLQFIAAGRPAELVRLVRDDEYFQQVSERVILARTILEAGSYQRLKTILATAPTDRTQAIALIEQLITLLTIRPDEAGVRRIDILLQARDRIVQNGNVKLQLAAAVL